MLGDLDGAFGEDYTFALALLGVRSLLEDVAAELPQWQESVASLPEQHGEPEAFEALLLGLCSMKSLLDELVTDATSSGPDRSDPIVDNLRELLR